MAEQADSRGESLYAGREIVREWLTGGLISVGLHASELSVRLIAAAVVEALSEAGWACPHDVEHAKAGK